MAGICSEECGSDDDCNSDQKCCSNGCGHTCMDPVSIPYMAPPRECPEEDEGPVLCDGQECTTDSCDNSQLCCENSCGSRLCVDGVLPPYPCTRTIDGMSGGDMLGSFIPRCREEDGSFLALQCFSHYCWCVDTASGEPTSDMVESGSVGALECSGIHVQVTALGVLCFSYCHILYINNCSFFSAVCLLCVSKQAVSTTGRCTTMKMWWRDMEDVGRGKTSSHVCGALLPGLLV